MHLRLQEVLHGKVHGLGVALSRFSAFVHKSNINQARNFADEHLVLAAGNSYDLQTTDRIMQFKSKLHTGSQGPRLPKPLNYTEQFGLVPVVAHGFDDSIGEVSETVDEFNKVYAD
jgi:hypothetical protein